jgi:hypothetical protein
MHYYKFNIINLNENQFIYPINLNNITLFDNTQRAFWRGNVKIPKGASCLGRLIANTADLNTWLKTDFGSIKPSIKLNWNTSGSDDQGKALNNPYPDSSTYDTWEADKQNYFGLISFGDSVSYQTIIQKLVKTSDETVSHEYDSTYDYWAFAQAGTLVSESKWKVFRVNKSTTRKQYANGSESYTNIGENLSTLSYS